MKNTRYTVFGWYYHPGRQFEFVRVITPFKHTLSTKVLPTQLSACMYIPTSIKLNCMLISLFSHKESMDTQPCAEWCNKLGIHSSSLISQHTYRLNSHSLHTFPMYCCVPPVVIKPSLLAVCSCVYLRLNKGCLGNSMSCNAHK